MLTTKNEILELCSKAPRLQTLILTNLNLSLSPEKLAKFISKCHLLENIDFSNNNFKTIDFPATFTSMPALTSLNLSSNIGLVKLTGNTPQPLKTLDISFLPNLENMPETVEGNSRLINLYMEGDVSLFDLKWAGFDRLEKIVVPYALQCCEFRQVDLGVHGIRSLGVPGLPITTTVKYQTQTQKFSTGIHCHTTRNSDLEVYKVVFWKCRVSGWN